ncbi:MAG: hypothetical protein Q8Q87_01265 [Candidatus Omnitrophota bacterium]|nr:hypothetical protein [Candidatus Omnitrophota bacterium]
MKKIFSIFLVLMTAAFFANLSLAAEHPGKAAEAEHKEHPGKAQETEHPPHGIAPGKAVAEHPGAGSTLSAASVIKGIKSHIKNITAANAGVFPITDPVQKKALKLKLIKVHEDKVSYIKKDDAYFACTDFKTEDGREMYDIDFWMKADKKGNLKVYETKIHKKDGKPRFTYRDDEIAAVK